MKLRKEKKNIFPCLVLFHISNIQVIYLYYFRLVIRVINFLINLRE
uniref:Uncharacterized protein n=1 Tax=Solanum lycopersicum TaxID=4081 RepID=A0A3Q7F650_SOLLC